MRGLLALTTALMLISAACSGGTTQPTEAPVTGNDTPAATSETTEPQGNESGDRLVSLRLH